MRYGGYENLGFPDKWGCLGVIIMDFECLQVTYPPFSSVLKLVVEVFLPKNVRFGKYWRFGVFGLHGHLDPIAIFSFGFGGDLPPHFQVLWIQWCKKPTIIYHHLEDMGGFDFSVSGWLSLYVQRIWTFSGPVMSSFAKIMEICEVLPKI